jgi:hypothetical protein
MLGAMVELVDGFPGSNIEVRAVYREFATDDTQSAGAWSSFGAPATESVPKQTVSTNVSPTGLYLQLGLALTVTGTTPVARHVMAELRYPIAAG